jgi:hypothetical protein
VNVTRPTNWQELQDLVNRTRAEMQQRVH